MAIKIQLRGDTLTNWTKANPVLMDREVALVATDSSKPNVYDSKKVGDGVHKFSELPMLGFNCLQEKGTSTQFPMSQNAVTKEIQELTTVTDTITEAVYEIMSKMDANAKDSLLLFVPSTRNGFAFSDILAFDETTSEATINDYMSPYWDKLVKYANGTLSGNIYAISDDTDCSQGSCTLPTISYVMQMSVRDYMKGLNVGEIESLTLYTSNVRNGVHVCLTFAKKSSGIVLLEKREYKDLEVRPYFISLVMANSHIDNSGITVRTDKDLQVQDGYRIALFRKTRVRTSPRSAKYRNLGVDYRLVDTKYQGNDVSANRDLVIGSEFRFLPNTTGHFLTLTSASGIKLTPFELAFAYTKFTETNILRVYGTKARDIHKFSVYNLTETAKISIGIAVIKEEKDSSIYKICSNMIKVDLVFSNVDAENNPIASWTKEGVKAGFHCHIK